MGTQEWPFPDPQSVAVIADKRILQGQGCIAYVSHDRDDGMWRFHTNRAGPLNENDVSVISLMNVADLDSTVFAMANLPVDWHAWRGSRDSEWMATVNKD
ncbi:hypothetical protein [Burkholderia cepacia]|uniref:hypothetical protein n=1 Tax=Burkholderia cepacia TaxID=292 RepID=UPI0009BCF764|nr:hypothetical protein [Burkholderia cepacia]